LALLGLAFGVCGCGVAACTAAKGVSKPTKSASMANSRAHRAVRCDVISLLPERIMVLPSSRTTRAESLPARSADGIAVSAAELARTFACLIVTSARRAVDNDLLQSVP
jgi:hypothetical protein